MTPWREDAAPSVRVLRRAIHPFAITSSGRADGGREIESEPNRRAHSEEQRRTVMTMLGEPA